MVTRGQKGLKEVAKGYRRLQEVTMSMKYYKELQWGTRGSMAFTRDYKG